MTVNTIDNTHNLFLIGFRQFSKRNYIESPNVEGKMLEIGSR